MSATTTTTIQGVSVLSRQKKRGGTDVFELGLSPTGIEVRRPGRPVQQLSWDRVSEWEIEERKGYLLLTFRGRGATTPLVVPGWSLDDLELLIRDITVHATTYVPEGPGPVVTDGNGEAESVRRPRSAARTAGTAGTAAPVAPAAAPNVAAPAPSPAGAGHTDCGAPGAPRPDAGGASPATGNAHSTPAAPAPGVVEART